MLTRTLLGAAATLALGSAASAQTMIEWWHAMDGKLGEKVEAIAKEYNGTQGQCAVKAVYKGNYTETMTAAIAAFRAKQQPDIVQVFEVGTATMMAAKGAVMPVHELMEKHGKGFDPNSYLKAVTGYYSTSDGKMLSMPFNSSTPILYYNKDAFKAAGLDPETPPKTWDDVAAYSKKIVDSGAAKCGFTTGWQTWIQVENFSALHDVPYASAGNGFDGVNTELQFNSPLHVKHLENLSQWAKDGLFKYGGRRSEMGPMFLSGECAMYMNSSAARAGVLDGAKTFEVGYGPLPYYADVKPEPQNSIIGGATLWVLAGKPDSNYQCAADFMSHLSKPEIQADWHQFSGYLPITAAAYDLSKSQGYYDKNKGSDIPIIQMTGKEPTANSKGLRLGNFVQIRDIVDEELEALWAGKKTAKEALDTAVERGNAELRKFEKANAS